MTTHSSTVVLACPIASLCTDGDDNKPCFFPPPIANQIKRCLRFPFRPQTQIDERQSFSQMNSGEHSAAYYQIAV